MENYSVLDLRHTQCYFYRVLYPATHCPSCYSSIILYIMSEYMSFIITLDVTVALRTFCTAAKFGRSQYVLFTKNRRCPRPRATPVLESNNHYWQQQTSRTINLMKILFLVQQQPLLSLLSLLVSFLLVQMTLFSCWYYELIMIFHDSSLFL